MTIITIYERQNGVIGLAKDYKSAIMLLANSGWLSDWTEINTNDEREWACLKDSLGDEWLVSILAWSIEDFNDFWDWDFYLAENEVYDYEEGKPVPLFK